MKIGVLGIAALTLLFIEAVESNIRCYVCTTQTGLNADKCGDDFSISIPTSYCEGSCQKTRGYRDDGGRRVVEVTRGCVPKTGDRCYDGNHYGISAKICTCNEEYCNSGQTLTITRWWTFVSGFCFVLMKILFM